jgi:hypothetical protein
VFITQAVIAHGAAANARQDAASFIRLGAPTHPRPRQRKARSSRGGGRRGQGDGGDGLLERGAGGDGLPPGLDVGAGGDEPGLGGLAEVEQVGRVVGVGERELVPGEVLVAGQVRLVHVEHLGELLRVLLHHRRVGGAAQERPHEQLEHQRRCVRVEVVRLHL